jgi:N-acetylmuramoyl-L-alanine amidase
VKTSRLTRPDRLVVDIDNAKATPRVLRNEIHASDTFVHEITVTALDGGVQVTLLLDSPAKYTASLLPDPYRLELELREWESVTKTGDPSGQHHPPKTDRAAIATKSPEQHNKLQAIFFPQHGAARARGHKANIGRVVIDAGHGGDDYGTIGINGLREKDVVLDIAIRLGRLLRSSGAEVVYTRVGDYFVPLQARTAVANREQADLFISIHANSSSDRLNRGVETYFLSFTSSPEELELAKRENTVPPKSAGQLRALLQNIAHQRKIYESREFAVGVQRALTVSLPEAPNRGVKKAPFLVLTGTRMPAILSEISFLTNSSDEHKLATPEYRQKIAEALFVGSSDYIMMAGGIGGPGMANMRLASESNSSAPRIGNFRITDDVLEFIAAHRIFLVASCVLSAVWSFLLLGPDDCKGDHHNSSSN